MSLLGSLFAALLILAVPIAFALGIAATAYLAIVHGMALSAVPQRIFAGLDQFVLMSIPFYILAGFVMNEVQLTQRLVQFAEFLVGRWKGGLAQVTVVTSMFFGGISGAAAAEAAAIGSILIPAMTRAGYKRDFATAVTVCASIVGPLIPPSIPMLVYGVSSGASIGALFLAGVAPGIAVGVGMLVLNRFLARNFPLPAASLADAPPGAGGTSSAVAFWKSLRSALLALAMPVIILSGVVGGIFTPTESSVAAVVYAVTVGLLLRTLSLASFGRLLVSTAIISSTVMFIIANANLVGWVMAFEQIPQAIAQLFLSLTENRYVFLLLVAILLLIVGLFLETSGAIIILTPVLLPAAQAYGIDPVHFGVVIVFGLVIGLVTPPVGLCLFVGCSIGQVSLQQLVRATLPYLALFVALYMVFLFVPAASLWLPSIMMN